MRCAESESQHCFSKSGKPSGKSWGNDRQSKGGQEAVFSAIRIWSSDMESKGILSHKRLPAMTATPQTSLLLRAAKLVGALAAAILEAAATLVAAAALAAATLTGDDQRKNERQGAEPGKHRCGDFWKSKKILSGRTDPCHRSLVWYSRTAFAIPRTMQILSGVVRD